VLDHAKGENALVAKLGLRVRAVTLGGLGEVIPSELRDNHSPSFEVDKTDKFS
jgi:hypothetical protein